MSEWSHLPNAKHVDRVLESLKLHPETWGAAYDAAYDAAGSAAWYAAWYAARAAARGAAYDAAWGAARGAAWGAARGAAYGAAVALIAWDHSEKYLDMTPDELRIWGKLSDDPACILLLPMIIVLQEMEIA